MEIKEEELLHFFACWIECNNISISPKKLFDLFTTLNKCYEDRMMYDSWFRGIDVMN